MSNVQSQGEASFRFVRWVACPALDAWNGGAVSLWNIGKECDHFVFGTTDKNKGSSSWGNQNSYNDVIGGQPGASGTVGYTSDGDKYYKFDDLKTMVNFMWETTNTDNTLNPFKYEMVGYVLDNGDGTASYYVLDWSANTNEKSHNPLLVVAYKMLYRWAKCPARRRLI